MKKKVYNLIILDESGSMSDIRTATVSGIDETIQSIRKAQKENENQEHFISLVSFNSKCRTLHYDLTPVSEIEGFDGEKYCPDSLTPLYDAVGTALSRLRSQITDDDMVLVTIITDGLENDSKEYDYPSLTRLMDSVKAKGWVITYIGANQDALAEAHKMHIDNGLSYNATPRGVKAMMKMERSSRMEFYERLDEYRSPKEMCCCNYFDDKSKKKSK